MRNEALRSAVKSSLRSDVPPVVTRTGRCSEQYEIQPSRYKLKNIYEAVKIERLFMAERCRRAGSVRKQGWFGFVERTSDYWNRLPVYEDGRFVCGVNKADLPLFQGVCFFSDNGIPHKNETPLVTWIEGGVRFWRVANVQEIAQEIRKSH